MEIQNEGDSDYDIRLKFINNLEFNYLTIIICFNGIKHSVVQTKSSLAWKSTVGKTSIINQFFHRTFEQNCEVYSSLIIRQQQELTSSLKLLNMMT